MVRRARLFLRRGIYHVYCRTHRGEFIFNDPDTSAALVESAQLLSDHDGVAVFAWDLLSNHYLCAAAHK